MKYKLVYIEWVDAMSRSGWYFQSQIKEWVRDNPGRVTSVGYLFKETKNYIILAQGIDETNLEEGKACAALNFQKIPKGMIKKRKRLKI